MGLVASELQTFPGSTRLNCVYPFTIIYFSCNVLTRLPSWILNILKTFGWLKANGSVKISWVPNICQFLNHTSRITESIVPFLKELVWRVKSASGHNKVWWVAVGSTGAIEKVPHVLVARVESVSKGFLGEMTPRLDNEGEIERGWQKSEIWGRCVKRNPC